MKQSEIKLIDAIKGLSAFAPIKILFNGIVLYNDYDSEIEIESGVFGEDSPPLEAIKGRLWQMENYVVTDIKVSIVQHHHSIVELWGI